MIEDHWSNNKFGGQLLGSILFGLGWVGGAWLINRFSGGGGADFFVVFLAAASGLFAGLRAHPSRSAS